ncbi:MAG: hypothetical protein KIT31_23915 [Deltaproteobacteria bacterium]|nr:hypothetical protein [Deltaproteobacteria bacterium]
MPPAEAAPIQLTKEQIAEAKAKVSAKHGAAHRARIERGVDQVALHWRASDGDLAEFCVAHFAAEPKDLDVLFDRLQAMFEQVDGHFLELGRSARWGNEVEAGPVLPVDALLAAYDAGAHVNEDMFASKVAFSVLLNFPLTRLADRIRDGAGYTRRQWAEARLAGRFARRLPGELALAASQAEAAADEYIAGYNLWMHHVLGEGGERRFAAKKRLISHWNLRDELKANYADKDGLAKQRTIARVMDRIVTQTIPRAVIDNPTVDWDPVANKVVAAAAGTVEDNAPKGRLAPSDEREPDLRHENVRRHFAAAQKIDKLSPLAPTLIERAFTNAEVPEARVREILVEILSSPLAEVVSKDIARRLGRPLEPHDLWYEYGGGDIPEAELDAVTKKKYPTAAAFAADIPRILRDLGFTPERAKYLSEHIAVDPSRGAGHAMEARRRGDKAHLRTRVVPGGMDYKGYNIAVHELGHNVEQVFGLYDVDYTLLAGVPNTAFTEALAFLFQERNLALIGRSSRGAEVEKLRVLDAYWNTREIAGSALVEMDVWRWLYAHPSATAGEIREATVRIARETWDKYYAPYLGGAKGTSLLGIYSHTLGSPLYLFNYVLGHLIAFQVEEHVAGKDKATFAKEFERVSRLGQILPDLWMKAATGAPVGPKAMLDATAKAISAKP